MPVAITEDLEIYYEVHGSGEPLILIAGIGGDHTTWLEHLPELSQHFTCLVFDNRGMGRTGCPESLYSSRLFAQDTSALMDVVGIESAHVVGLSMGGMIAQELCINFPQKVKSLLLCSTWARMDVYLADLYELWEKLALQVGLDMAIEDALFWSFTPALYNNRPEFIKSILGSLHDNPGAGRAFARQARACIEHDTLARLPQIRTRTRILVGTEDIMTPYRFAEQLQRGIPGSELIRLEGCPHAFNGEFPEIFIREVISFLS